MASPLGDAGVAVSAKSLVVHGAEISCVDRRGAACNAAKSGTDLTLRFSRQQSTALNSAFDVIGERQQAKVRRIATCSVRTGRATGASQVPFVASVIDGQFCGYGAVSKFPSKSVSGDLPSDSAKLAVAALERSLPRPALVRAADAYSRVEERFSSSTDVLGVKLAPWRQQRVTCSAPALVVLRAVASSPRFFGADAHGAEQIGRQWLAPSSIALIGSLRRWGMGTWLAALRSTKCTIGDAHYQHEGTEFAHPQGGQAHFLRDPLFEHSDARMESLARALITPEGSNIRGGMSDAMETLSDDVYDFAPREFGNLRNSGHPTVTDDGAVIYDRPPHVPRLSEAELRSEHHRGEIARKGRRRRREFRRA